MRTRITVLVFLVVSACALLGRLLSSSPEAAAGGSSKAEATVLYTEAKRYEPTAWLRGGERFPQGSRLVVDDGHQQRALVSTFAASADANVSFDGTKILFSGKQKPSDPWQVWEINLDGSKLHRIATVPDGAIRPMYLPEDRVVYSHRAGNRYVIEAVEAQGSGKPQLLTFAPGSYLVSDVLRDGRVLFESGFPLGSNGSPELYTVYPDGSGVESYRCDHGKARYAGRQVSSGDVVFTTAKGLARFTSALAHEAEIAAPAGDYAGDVAEYPSGEWLISWRADAKSDYQLKRWTPGSNKLFDVATQQGLNRVEPVVVGARVAPKRFPSALHEWPQANLLTLNVYTSKNLETPEGSVASVRAYALGANGKPKMLGTAPVESDGSLYIKVQGDAPVRFELLDRSGKVIQRQNSWMWSRKGEQRVCVGCHAGPEQSPENAVPAVLLRSTTPADLTGGNANTRTGGR